MIGIYKITSPNNRVYIGQSVDIEKRFKDYKNLSKKTKAQTKIYRSLLKYGVDNHLFDIIEECDIESLSDREGFWQDFFDCVNNGLNCYRVKSSDKSGYMCKETKDAISKSNTGKKPSEETLVKLRIKSTGNNNAMYGLKGESHPAYGNKSPLKGKKISQEQKDKISTTLNKGDYTGEKSYWFGKKRTDDFKNNISLKNKGKKKGGLNHQAKKVIDTETNIIYDCIKDAAKATNISYDTLKKYLQKKQDNVTSIVLLKDFLVDVPCNENDFKIKKIVDTATNKKYNTVSEVSRIFNISRYRLTKMLKGLSTNTTTLMYYE